LALSPLVQARETFMPETDDHRCRASRSKPICTLTSVTCQPAVRVSSLMPAERKHDAYASYRNTTFTAGLQHDYSPRMARNYDSIATNRTHSPPGPYTHSLRRPYPRTILSSVQR
jgi:hypothetical protein